MHWNLLKEIQFLVVAKHNCIQNTTSTSRCRRQYQHVAANLVVDGRKYDHVAQLLRELQWLPDGKYSKWILVTQSTVNDYTNRYIYKASFVLEMRGVILHNCIHSEKSPARPMLFYSTNCWHHFWVLFAVYFNSHSMYCTSITHYMMGNMTVKLPHIRPYFSYGVLCY